MPNLIQNFHKLTGGRFTAASGIVKRRHKRHDILLQAELLLTERALCLEGMIREISQSGMRYREATYHILDRRGASVAVRLLGRDIKGTIVNVSPHGYGVVFDEILTEQAVDRIVSASIDRVGAGDSVAIN